MFMFHELPPEVRRTIFGECASVLKPGRRLVVDSLQRGKTKKGLDHCVAGGDIAVASNATLVKLSLPFRERALFG
jgi:RNase P subunit RPR2